MMLGQAPDYVTFNGRSAQYATAPILVPPRRTVRLYVVNAGPNRVSSFHVVGGIFDHVYLDASAVPSLTGVQTVGVPVGGGAVFEVRLAEPGTIPSSPMRSPTPPRAPWGSYAPGDDRGVAATGRDRHPPVAERRRPSDH